MNLISFPWRAALLGIVLVTCVGCDQATKQYAIENFKGQPPISFLGDTFRIQYAENRGAFLSLMADLSPQARFWILTVANSVVMLIVAGYYFLSRELDRTFLVALALIVAGGVGNLIDRVRFDFVVDFMVLDSGIGPLRTGVFNVADMAITGGFLILLPRLLWGEEKEQTTSHPEPAT